MAKRGAKIGAGKNVESGMTRNASRGNDANPFTPQKDPQRDYMNVRELWSRLKTNGERYKPVWDDIGKYVSIAVDTNYIYQNNQNRAAQQLDQYIDDPTAAISVNQAGDYLIGIMWGTGQDIFDLVPSRYVLEYDDVSALEDWYSFATDQTLYHMNHEDAGWLTALQPYSYDQFSFGTSGIGIFPNKAFQRGLEDNALICRPYGIDSTRIDEGKAGMPDIVFTIYRWRTNRIVEELCSLNGEAIQQRIDSLPQKIRDAYQRGDVNQEFNLVCGVYPREDFDPKLIGKRATRYRGVWFLDDDPTNQIFYEEDFSERPISIARLVKVRGEVYGRSTGTLLMSSIRSNNYIVGNVIEVLEKMANPALGVWNNALFGDSVLDTSASGLTVFNSAFAAQNNSPLFPLHDVGDPAEIIKFLVPYLNDKITTAFKVDMLLDFNKESDMTATESLQRYAIRGKALSAILSQQKVELLSPSVKRAVSILNYMGELGVDAQDPRARALIAKQKRNRVIPDAVKKTIEAGRPWFEIKWNNELEKLQHTNAVQNLVQILQSITAISGVYPDIVEAVDWYKLLQEINSNLDYNNQILYSEKDFKAKVQAMIKARGQAAQAQVGQAQAAGNVDAAKAQQIRQQTQNGTAGGQAQS